MPWRGPDHPDDFPSLGWQVLDWCHAYLPSPRDPSKPLVFTDEQALQIVEWFRIDPMTGQLVYRRGYSRRSKGWGKSPVEASKAIAEFRGPVRFDGWDATGNPVGRPWGTKDDPRAWVQIGAISEDQTDNTWSVVHYFLTENDGKAADELGIDAGLTRCFLRDQPGAKLEPVTSAAGSREGQPITYGVLDESHLMTASNGGVKLARTIRRNVAKMGGRSYETTNSYEIGAGSVAEMSHHDVLAGKAGIFADEIEAPTHIDGVEVGPDAPDDVLLKALGVAYGDSWWVDKSRLVADSRDMPWTDAARFFFNWPQASDHETVIPGWSSLADLERDTAGVPTSRITSRLSWAVAVSSPVFGPSSAAIGKAGCRDDGKLHVEVVKYSDGTTWVVDECVRAFAENRGVPLRVLRTGSEGWLIPQLRERGVEVVEVSMTEYAQATGAFREMANANPPQLVHINQATLNRAVKGARLKPTSEGAATWMRSSAVEITPLVAVTVALGGVPLAVPVEFFAY